MKRLERGSILPLVALFAITALGAMLVLSYVTSALVHASWAQTAADAAALAGAGSGATAAQQAAQANHAQLVSFQVEGIDTVVVAKSGSYIRSAHARKSGPSYTMSDVQH